MRVYPVNLALEGKRCAVVGGGKVAARKVKGLLEAGAMVTVISPSVCAEIEELARDNDLNIVRREYKPDDLDGVAVAMAAADDAAANRSVVNDARAKKVLVNAADRPLDCDFMLPAVLRRGDVTVAVGTGGFSPTLAGRLRDVLAGAVGPEYGKLAQILGELRKNISEEGETLANHQQTFEALIDSDLVECLERRDYSAAARIVEDISGRKIDISSLENER